MFGVNECKGVFLENALQARVGSMILVGGLYERLALSLFIYVQRPPVWARQGIGVFYLQLFKPPRQLFLDACFCN